MGSRARQTGETADNPKPSSSYCSSMEQASKTAEGRLQYFSFLKQATTSDPQTLVNLALSAVGEGFIGLDSLSLDPTTKRKHSPDPESVETEDSKSRGGESPVKRIKVNYGSRYRPRQGGPHYAELAVNQLHEDFSYVEEKLIRAVFSAFNSLYAPAHLFLLAKQKEVLKRSHRTMVPPLPSKIDPNKEKGKGRALQDAEFDRERKWLLEELAKDIECIEIKDNDENEVESEGRVIECGCCFSEYLSKSDIKCMSIEGCESFFSPSALRRSLSEHQFNLWERIDQRREIAAAGLVLEDCPFCEFGCEIVDDKATFVCQNTEHCGKESCRRCKKLNHLPKTCEEVREDEAREGRHYIAEAMKEGCNKITCPFCNTISCYLCRKIVTGYDHFNTAQPGTKRRNGKCLLFDEVAERHNDDVIQAAAHALEHVRRELPHVNENELRVEPPPPPRHLRSYPRRHFRPPMQPHHAFDAFALFQEAMAPQFVQAQPVFQPAPPNVPIIDPAAFREHAQPPPPPPPPPPVLQQAYGHMEHLGHPRLQQPDHIAAAAPPFPPGFLPAEIRGQGRYQQLNQQALQIRFATPAPQQLAQHHHIYRQLALPHQHNNATHHQPPPPSPTRAPLPLPPPAYQFLPPIEARQQAPNPLPTPYEFHEPLGNPLPPAQPQYRPLAAHPAPTRQRAQTFAPAPPLGLMNRPPQNQAAIMNPPPNQPHIHYHPQLNSPMLPMPNIYTPPANHPHQGMQQQELMVKTMQFLRNYHAVESSPKVSTVEREREHSSRLSALSNFSIGDMFRDVRDGPKSVKFPEKLLKVLEQKLQNIAMGKDPGYSDQLVRRTMAKFYNQFMNDSFKRQMKENRKIEELILMFATHATAVLRKEPTLIGDGWKVELNSHIAQFVKMLRECLRNVNVSPELLSRLDIYTAKLAPSTQASSDSGYDSASTSRDRDSISVPSVSTSIANMALVRTVGHLFKVPDQVVQKEVDQLRGQVVTEKAAMNDLKTCLKNINAGATFPGRREDFENEAAWNHWKTLETTHLQQLMVIMAQFNPELAKSTPSDILPSIQHSNARPGSLYHVDSPGGANARHGSISSRRSMFLDHAIDEDGDEELPVGHHFTFIPPNPRKYYRRLLEYCLVADLEIMMSPEVDDNDEVSLGILSPPHIELINECALRWRIGHSYRVSCFLDLVKQFYERNDVPLECIPEALQNVLKVMHENDVENWPAQDSEYLSSVYASLFNVFLSSLYHCMDALPNLKPSEVEPYLAVLEQVQSSGLLERFHVDINARLTDVQHRIREVSAHFYESKMQELQKAPGVNRALPLLLMMDELEKSAKLLDKRFPEPILGELDLVSIVVEIAIPHYIADLQNSQRRLFESSMNGPTPDVPIQDIFALYRRTKTLLDMYAAFVPRGDINFNITGFFEPYVRQWLLNIDSKTEQWVQAAVAADKFEAEGAEGHSSSIVDLFDSLRSPINFLQDLEWEDEYQNARFFTALSKTLSKTVEQYCRNIESMFMSEMFPRPTDYIQPQKSSAWIERARQLAAAGEKRIEPFNFRPESCVKLNNVEAARKLLDNMYTQMQADKMAEAVQKHAPPVPEKLERDRFLFTVKIVIAEGLVPSDGSPSAKLDTFITLSDPEGNRLAKTRTIYETLNPRWDETFDISVEKELWLMVSVRDRALVGKHDTVGRAYLCLDPRRFGDFLAHELWMNLEPHGRVLIRVSMEGEKDDIQFFFGRAFRSLKRAEADMLRIFIDKMAPFIQQCLSRTVLKSLIKSNSALDYNKALGNVTALYRSAIGTSSNEVQIPLPQNEKPRVRPEELTDVEIEQAILPLFDYFDANLQTLNTYLSETAKEMVMTRVWKEILVILEGLLIPPLSDISSDMKPLSDKEVDIVFKWLKFLRDYFYAGGEGPVPLEALQNQKYRDVLSVRLYYDWHTDDLMEECVRMMQQNLRSAPAVKKRAKSVYSQRNLGTIKERKKEKRQEKEVTSEETIMRILRMRFVLSVLLALPALIMYDRPNTSEFISQQLQIMTAMQAEQEKRAKELEQRKLKRPANRPTSQIPPLPPLPGS
ncbi:hypothetical protein H0H87_010705 [Tephrocybe sp. NHM501043]|nr:hypothetical protein H0H87_010705 [Tephrocybe sp. NHM501043]